MVRVSKTKGVLTTNYLVDINNPTGYAQVLEEIQNTHVVRSYSYGLDLISQTQKLEDGSWQLSFYGYDGHGSVRYLTNAEGNVTDTYDYDAFGNLINSTGTTQNNYLYAGEQFDPDLGLYYNRVRYLDVRTGRFWGMDSLAGDPESPSSQHRYVFASNNPADQVDPSGMASLLDRAIAGIKVHNRIGDDFVKGSTLRVSNRAIRTILARFLNIDLPDQSRPDLVDGATHEVYEIKTTSSFAVGKTQLEGYIEKLNQAEPSIVWRAGSSYAPPQILRSIYKSYDACVEPPVDGVILYSLSDTSKDETDDGSEIDLAFVSVLLIAPLVMKATAAIQASLRIQWGVAVAKPAPVI